MRSSWFILIGLMTATASFDCNAPAPQRVCGEVIALAVRPSQRLEHWLELDGARYLSDTWPLLAQALLGKKPADLTPGSDFYVPDYRGLLSCCVSRTCPGRVLYGSDQSHPPRERFGEATHTLQASEMPSHSHGYQDTYWSENS